MQPLKPVNPEKLPLTYHLTIVRDPDKGSRVWSVVGTVMRGESVIARKVLGSDEDKQSMLDQLSRIAMQTFYFDNPKTYFPEA